MTSISFTVELEAEEARARLRTMIDRVENRRPFLNEVGQVLADSTRARFRTATAPDGSPWAPLHPKTVRARLRRRRAAIAILRETGNLVGSIHHEATNDEVRIGATADYAAIHQLGGTIDIPAREQTLYFRKAKKGGGRRFASKAKATSTQTVQRKGHKITIPARPFLGLSTDDEADIFEAAGRWLGV